MMQVSYDISFIIVRYTIILDKSGSMSTRDAGDNTRWQESDEAIEHMTEQLQDVSLLITSLVYFLKLCRFARKD